MTRFVIGPDASLRWLARPRPWPSGTRLLAPTLWRSQVLAALYAQVRAGQLDRPTARARLNQLRALSPRLLGDRVLQARAWDIALAQDWPDTFVAEYIALTQLQADALVVEDPAIAAAAAGLVRVVPLAQALGE